MNEVPIYGMKGISIQPIPNQRFDTTIKIYLSEGINQIETSVTNQKGLESYKMPLTVQYLPRKKQPSKLYFVGIGIDQFLNPTYNLQYSVKDIRDLTASLKKKYGKSIVIDTLLNRSVTIENIKALKKRLTKTNVNDRVIISYSGHGLLNKELDYFLSTYGVDFNNPDNAGLTYEAMEDLTDGIPARKKLMLIDACHSGEVDKETQDAITEMSTGDSNNTVGAKGVTPLIPAAGKKIGMKNSFQLMQELFVKVGKRTGTTVISAAAGTQFALERGDLKNGVFTYSILEYLQNNNSVTVTELKKYVNLRVPELTNGLQVPTTRSETNAAEWKVW